MMDATEFIVSKDLCYIKRKKRTVKDIKNMCEHLEKIERVGKMLNLDNVVIELAKDIFTYVYTIHRYKVYRMINRSDVAFASIFLYIASEYLGHGLTIQKIVRLGNVRAYKLNRNIKKVEKILQDNGYDITNAIIKYYSSKFNLDMFDVDYIIRLYNMLKEHKNEYTNIMASICYTIVRFKGISVYKLSEKIGVSFMSIYRYLDYVDSIMVVNLRKQASRLPCEPNHIVDTKDIVREQV